MVSAVRPKKIVDVGCGVGTWAAQYVASGVSDVLGIDGDYVERSQLVIPPEKFRPADLGGPLRAADFGRFDLVNCLEVAEHLSKDVADNFVQFLTDLAGVVLFGAAIPGQGGTNHINEQWQSYWIAKFEDRGYKPIDAIRQRFWTQPVEWWYLQNTFIFASPQRYSELSVYEEKLVDVIHPRLYERRVAELRKARSDLAAAQKKLEQKTNAN